MEENKNTPCGAEAEQSQGFAASLYAWLQAAMVALVAIILLFTFVGRCTYVDGESMEPTLWNKDLMLVQVAAYTPRQGDIVVLTKHFASVETSIVKRVIATGGQTVDIDYAAGTVTVDGVVLDEPYIMEPMAYSSGTDHVVVPEGSLFVMGDNRNHSSDSRRPELGTVDERYVIGRVFFVVLPFSHFGSIR